MGAVRFPAVRSFTAGGGETIFSVRKPCLAEWLWNSRFTPPHTPPSNETYSLRVCPTGRHKAQITVVFSFTPPGYPLQRIAVQIAVQIVDTPLGFAAKRSIRDRIVSLRLFVQGGRE